MPEIFPAVEGDENSSLSKNFSGRFLSSHYEALNSLAEAGGYKSINDFEYMDPAMLEDFGIELEEEQIEWYPATDGIAAFEALSKDPGLPDDASLKEEISELLQILRGIPDSSKGWNLQQDI